MKPGDLVRLVQHPGFVNIFVKESGDRIGIVIRSVVHEDMFPVNSYCNWWIMFDEILLPFPASNLKVVNEAR